MRPCVSEPFDDANNWLVITTLHEIGMNEILSRLLMCHFFSTNIHQIMNVRYYLSTNSPEKHRDSNQIFIK